MKSLRWIVAAAVVGLASAGVGVAGASTTAAPACAAPTGPPAPVTSTTVDTLHEAYDCVFAHYFGGDRLDDRVLLTGAMAGFVQELDRRGLDRADVGMPALTGDRDADWAAFGAVYERATGRVPAAVRQPLAEAAMRGMIASLNDNHANWNYAVYPPNYVSGEGYGLGIRTAPVSPIAAAVPGEALPPLYISSVTGGPAEDGGLRAGDVIDAVDGAPPFVDGVVAEGAMNLVAPQWPDANPVVLTLTRPATGRTWTVRLTPRLFTPIPASTAVVT